MRRNLDRDAAIRQLVPINRLPPENQEVLLQASTFQTVFDGQAIYVQGHQDNYVHYLIDGTVEFLWNGNIVKRLPAGIKAARRALDKPGRKRHTVRAVSNCTVLRIARKDFDQQLEEGNLLTGPQQVEVSEIAAEKSSNWMIKMLQSKLFERLPALNIQKIFGRMERITVSADDVVVKQDEIGDFYYVIEQGFCEVTRQIPGGKEIHLADVAAGDAFGEVALIAGSARTASVAMLSDGTLMRLPIDDFNELIRGPLLRGISATTAISRIDRGAQWLDIRYPVVHAKTTLRASLNVPFNVLRLQANRLDMAKRYIVCGDDPTDSSVGAFLLIERGFTVDYLDEPLSVLLAEHPSVLVPPPQPAVEPEVVAIPERKPVQALEPSSAVEPPPSNTQTSPSATEEPDMDEQRPDGDRFESTIDKIDRLYSQKEWEKEKASRLPVEDYAHTATGMRLADLIDEMEENNDQLPATDSTLGPKLSSTSEIRLDDVIDIAPEPSDAGDQNGPNVLLVDTRAPLPVSHDEILQDELFEESDELTQIVREFEYRVRDHAESVALKRAHAIEERYQHKLKRLRKAAAIEVRKRQDIARQKYQQQFQKKELQLRAHYKKLMALANKITEQKAQLQVAKKQFEDKLSAANAVYKQVEDMRKTLRQHIGDLPAERPADVRQSA